MRRCWTIYSAGFALASDARLLPRIYCKLLMPIVCPGWARLDQVECIDSTPTNHIKRALHCRGIFFQLQRRSTCSLHSSTRTIKPIASSCCLLADEGCGSRPSFAAAMHALLQAPIGCCLPAPPHRHWRRATFGQPLCYQPHGHGAPARHKPLVPRQCTAPGGST